MERRKFQGKDSVVNLMCSGGDSIVSWKSFCEVEHYLRGCKSNLLWNRNNLPFVVVARACWVMYSTRLYRDHKPKQRRMHGWRFHCFHRGLSKLWDIWREWCMWSTDYYVSEFVFTYKSVTGCIDWAALQGTEMMSCKKETIGSNSDCRSRTARYWRELYPGYTKLTVLKSEQHTCLAPHELSWQGWGSSRQLQQRVSFLAGVWY